MRALRRTVVILLFEKKFHVLLFNDTSHVGRDSGDKRRNEPFFDRFVCTKLSFDVYGTATALKLSGFRRCQPLKSARR